ncbi:MAG: conjugal transfer protein TraW [bacterium]|nr:conjugal transfer protein TraW [bacterium]
MRLRKKIIAISVAGSLIVTSGGAWAYLGVMDTNVTDIATAIWQEAMLAAANLTNYNFNTTIGAINQTAAAVGASSDKAMAAAEQQTKQLQDGQLEAIRIKQNAEVADKYQLAADPCTTGSMSDIIDETGRSVAGSYGRFGSGGGGGRVQPGTAAVALAVREVGPANSPSREISNARTAKQHVDGNLYCTADESNGPGTKQYCRGEGGYPNGDVDPETLFRGAGSVKRGIATRTFDDRQMDAVNAYLRNIGGGSALGAALTEKQAKSAFGGQYFGLQKELEQVLLLAKEPFTESAANSTPQAITKTLMSTITVNSPGAKDFYNKRAAAAGGYPKGISWMDLMDIDVMRRYGNAEWYTAMSAATPEAVARESMFMQAQSNYLALENLKRQEKIGIYLGAILASQARQEYIPKLEAKRGEMQRAGF